MIRYHPGAELWGGEPLAALRRIQEEINRAFGDQHSTASAEFPPVNIWRSAEGIIITAEIPGVSLDAIDLTVHQNTLTIKGRRDADPRDGGASYHRRERVFGPFARTIELPYAVDAERVRASASSGILSIELPRPASDRPRKIAITQV
ncbi:MAG: Hsp20/alpha crystallin family protein [Rhodospirillales bacterium]|nr:Hsp20/alpha crystallin family protein [Rhodospirillales bacterium]